MKNSESLALEIDVHSAKRLMDQIQDLLLIDCREAIEYEICRIEGSTLIPLQQIPRQIQALRAYQEKPVIVYCHHGMRSLHAVRWLRQDGFVQVQSLAGGIDHWTTEIDPALPRY